ncbi:MAG TPA: hypothetical protein VHF07_06150 [Nitrospiraceae bacterium]|nr:hypothetical protein [Nitrospiraceae bacterium]
MRYASFAGCLLLACFTFPLAGHALEFTADQITKTDGRIQKAVIYYRDDMWRIEHHSMGPVNVTIVRKDKQVVWMLLSRMRHFKSVPYGADHDLLVSERLDGEVAREEIGNEVREGHPTILYEVTTKHGEHADVYYQWLATDIHFPMKLARKDGSWIIEYQHVKMRPVSDYLFQLPVNFQPLEEFGKPNDKQAPPDRLPTETKPKM